MTDDAAGVNDVGGSAKCITFAQIRIMAVENRVGDTKLFRLITSLLKIRKHRDRKHKDAFLTVLLMELLEMNHLLSRERSVAGEESDSDFRVANFAVLTTEGETCPVTG